MVQILLRLLSYPTLNLVSRLLYRKQIVVHFYLVADKLLNSLMCCIYNVCRNYASMLKSKDNLISLVFFSMSFFFFYLFIPFASVTGCERLFISPCQMYISHSFTVSTPSKILTDLCQIQTGGFFFPSSRFPVYESPSCVVIAPSHLNFQSSHILFSKCNLYQSRRH